MTDQITWGPQQVLMVFLHKSAARNLKMIRETLDLGYVLYSLTYDRAYFKIDVKKENASC